MLRSLSAWIAGLWLLLTAVTAVSAPILIVDGTGKLTGARNVDVAGTLYDVDFKDGSCQGLFTGCNELTDFQFDTPAKALAAADALMAQVFLGIYDTDPSLTNGCQLPLAASICDAFVPYATAGLMVTATARENQSSVADSSQFTFTFSISADTAVSDTLTWAVFSLADQSSTVPEPPTYACLFLAAGIALAMSRRRNRNRAGQHQRL